MYPVLLSMGPLHLTSFGLFLAMGAFLAVFIGWRLAKTYDIEEAKIFDTALVNFLGGVIAARLYTVLLNREVYDSLEKVIMINRYSGLSFWGGLLGGTLALWLFTRRAKLNFWQIADFTAVGVIMGISLGDFGCFFGGCAYGAVSNLPIAIPVVGLVGKRLPVSLIEGLVFLPAFYYLSKEVVKFHFSGKILAVFLIVLGTVKFFTEFFRGDSRVLFNLSGISLGHLFSIMIFVCGVVVFYTKSKRVILTDLQRFMKVFTQPKRLGKTLSSWKKSCYNHKTASKLRSLPKKITRRLNVKPTPRDIN